jgi:hypothetical protein
MFPKLSSFTQAQAQSQPHLKTDNHLDSDDEDDSPEAHERRAKRAAARKTLNGTAQERNGQFSKVAARKTCRDFEEDAHGRDFVANIAITPPLNPYSSSEESEEDPDDDPIPETLKTASNASQAAAADDDDDDDDKEESSDSESEVGKEDPDDEPTEKPVRNGHPNANDLDSKILEGIRRLSTQNPKPPAGPSSNRSPENEPETIFVFTVLRQDRKNGVDEKQKIMQVFFDRNEANKFAREFLQKRRKKNPVSFREVYDKHDDLYKGDVDWDEYGRESVMVFIRKELKTTKDIDNFELARYRERFPAKCWWVKRTLTSSTVDSETQNKTVMEKERILEGFADLTEANMQAANMFMEFVKPERNSIDDIAKWENEVRKAVRGERDAVNLRQGQFWAEMDVTEHELPWMMVWFKDLKNICFEVERLVLKGPLN